MKWLRTALLAWLLIAVLPAPLGAETLTTPAGLRGTWAHEAAACTDRQSDGRVAIGEKKIEFFASSCTITKVRNASKSTWRANAKCVESDDSQDVIIELRSVAAGRLILRVDSDEARALVRCAGNVPVR